MKFCRDYGKLCFLPWNKSMNFQNDHKIISEWRPPNSMENMLCGKYSTPKSLTQLFEKKFSNMHKNRSKKSQKR